MRKKNDTLIKWFQLANTMYLTSEEFGAVIRQVMIQDDTDGIRYKHLNEAALEDLKQSEQEWKEEFNKLKFRNPLILAAYNSLCYQVNNSTEGFYKLLENMQNKKDDSQAKKDFEIEYGLNIKFENLNKETPSLFPSKKDIENYISELEEKDIPRDEITNIIDILASEIKKNKCKKHWLVYKKQIENQLGI